VNRPSLHRHEGGGAPVFPLWSCQGSCHLSEAGRVGSPTQKRTSRLGSGGEFRRTSFWARGLPRDWGARSTTGDAGEGEMMPFKIPFHLERAKKSASASVSPLRGPDGGTGSNHHVGPRRISGNFFHLGDLWARRPGWSFGGSRFCRWMTPMARRALQPMAESAYGPSGFLTVSIGRRGGGGSGYLDGDVGRGLIAGLRAPSGGIGGGRATKTKTTSGNRPGACLALAATRSSNVEARLRPAGFFTGSRGHRPQKLPYAPNQRVGPPHSF